MEKVTEVRTVSSLPPLCRDCHKQGLDVAECRIRQYSFKLFGKKCPREEEPQNSPALTKGSEEAQARRDDFLEVNPSNIVWKKSVRPLDKKHVENLRKSLLASERGQITPVVVKRLENGMYEGVVHHHLYEACKLANRNVLIRVHKFHGETEEREWALVENLHRKELTALERAEAYKELYKAHRAELGDQVKDTHIIASMTQGIQEIPGEKAPAEKTVWKYVELADDFNPNIREILTGEKNFGLRHAEQLKRLKDKPEEQKRVAEAFIRSCIEAKPWTVSRLKQEVDDYLKVGEAATQKVKEALEKSGITLQHAAEIAKVKSEYQDKLTDIAVHGRLRPTEVKKVADFVETHVEEVPTLFEGTPKEIVAVAEGKAVLKTAEDVEKFFRGKKGQAMVEEFTCPGCGRKFGVNWFKGEIVWEGER